MVSEEDRDGQCLYIKGGMPAACQVFCCVDTYVKLYAGASAHMPAVPLCLRYPYSYVSDYMPVPLCHCPYAYTNVL